MVERFKSFEIHHSVQSSVYTYCVEEENREDEDEEDTIEGDGVHCG